jgi:hypothetical protein
MFTGYFSPSMHANTDVFEHGQEPIPVCGRLTIGARKENLSDSVADELASEVKPL